MSDSYTRRFPTAEELPDSDDTPVDNELQDLIPSLLKRLLASIWPERYDWFWGTDMGIYFDPDDPPVVPDGFLALGVPRVKDENLRRSYVLWEENTAPILALEVVSRSRRGEYRQKKIDYAELGIRYYVIYNTQRRVKATFEVYRLEGEEYVLLEGNPVWLPEVGLGLGVERGIDQGVEREWLYWYDEAGHRYPTPEEREQAARQRAETAEQRAETAEQRAERLAERLRALGVDPDA
ncbi:Uma2 family endonuclease [Gloeobacter kilaueensis]|uniref:Putative restriction endonuclease domain-containing protein n=1 Tax=Gloeobacter kilaueensis (strain ATCC BAA-2537 / CCAP 1431/1 / ULC 316 / JS1) TaxID=1183438 RepID=U5QML7_GLOK1|nr:Uma2 family endonuclease [Gloeobacter kilaueensis]AGY60247.1 hypothetical protein GKIL_4001 [Gloeobacter kilaueensis JS1]